MEKGRAVKGRGRQKDQVCHCMYQLPMTHGPICMAPAYQ